jgi:hypothetical protein
MIELVCQELASSEGPEAQPGPVQCMSFVQARKQLWCSWGDGVIGVWEVADPEPSTSAEVIFPPIGSCVYSFA